MGQESKHIHIKITAVPIKKAVIKFKAHYFGGTKKKRLRHEDFSQNHRTKAESIGISLSRAHQMSKTIKLPIEFSILTLKSLLKIF